MNPPVSNSATLNQESNRSDCEYWNSQVLSESRTLPITTSELDIYKNGYILSHWTINRQRTNTSTTRPSVIQESERQKWQYHILKYLITQWVPQNKDNT